MSEKPFATGHCLCGSVSFSVDAEPVLQAQCHCDQCKRASGQGHMSLAFFKEDAVHIEGEVTGYTKETDTGTTNTRHFCPSCGSRIHGINTGRPGIVSLSVGCFDDSSWFSPAAIVYNKRKPHWDFMDPAVKAFEEMPPPPPTA